MLANLLDEKLYPAAELISRYHEWWEHELVYDEQETHYHQGRATKPANLRSETPAGEIQALYGLSLGHFVVGDLMFEAAQREHFDPDRLSFSGRFHILRCRLPECDSHTEQSFWGVVRIASLGTRPSVYGAASQPHQSSCHQTEDVQVAEKTPRA